MQESLLFLHAWSTLNKKKKIPGINQLPVPRLHLASPSLLTVFYTSTVQLQSRISASLLLGTQVLSCPFIPNHRHLIRVAAWYAICSPAIQMYTSYFKLAGYISASVLLSLSLHLGGRCCLHWAICSSGFIISNSTYKQVFSHANAFHWAMCLGRVSQKRIQYWVVASLWLLLERCCPMPGIVVLL